MTTIISIKGKNERMGKLFKTPKHNLLYRGRPALEQTIEYMSQFGDVRVMTHENSPPDTGIVDMLLQMELPDKFFVVDCDVVPIKINQPKCTTVYCFKNVNELPNYSNYKLNDAGIIIDCNEKEKIYQWAGAGIYYFNNAKIFRSYTRDNAPKYISQIFKDMVTAKKKNEADTTSEIFRFGSLNTILNNVNELGV